MQTLILRLGDLCFPKGGPTSCPPICLCKLVSPWQGEKVAVDLARFLNEEFHEFIA